MDWSSGTRECWHPPRERDYCVVEGFCGGDTGEVERIVIREECTAAPVTNDGEYPGSNSDTGASSLSTEKIEQPTQSGARPAGFR